MKSIDDYVEKSVYYESHHHHGFLGFGSKTETTTTKKYYEMFYAHNYYLALSMRQISWFTLRLSEFPLPQMSDSFKKTLDFLPTKYNASDAKTVAIYNMFFEAFGTDIVTSADMGGMVWAENWFESCLTKIYSDVCITHEVRRGWWFVHHHKITEHCDKRITHDFKNFTKYHYEMLGGTSGKIPKKDWDKWVKSVKYDPRPVKYSLIPIYYILPDSHPSKKALVEATLDFLIKNQKNRDLVISALESIRPPPASVCKRPKHNSRLIDTLDDIEDHIVKPKPADVLCPFVGYQGSYCPTEYQTKRPDVATKNELSLPKGVGLTIDITNGELKLPALEYTNSKRKWLDTVTGLSYAIPSGVSLTEDGISTENVPKINVFKDEEQLTLIWEKGYKQGYWLGGEFGKSKGILNLYEKFFSKQQATSINQHPRALYRLSLDDGWEKHLNQFALTALKALPEEYDANIYSRFMDTWGTHVAKETLVGGMLEQQLIMKDCVWKSPYLSGGLTERQLKSYLTMELGKSTPKDPYYIARRKMHIDHRIGGNPELKDDKKWKQTLSKNPALIKIYKQVDWSTVAAAAGAVSAQVQKNLGRALLERRTTREKQREEERQLTRKKRIEYLQGPRPVVAMVAHGRRGSIAPTLETGKYMTLKGFTACPPGLSDAQSKRDCNTGLYITSWNHFRLTEPLRYERSERGEMRSVRCFDLDWNRRCITHRGPWVRNGCSLQPFATGQERPFHEPVPGHTVVAMVCADCQLVTSGFPQDSTLKCVCPGY